MSSRRLSIVAGASTTIALVSAALVATTTTTAQAAPVSFEACPEPYPMTQPGTTTSNYTPGQTFTGLTSVDSGPPKEFTATYVGTLDNGIADGLDMLVFDLEGPRITKIDGSVDAGNWAGISGSPVYDNATGQLVGSVSYGFTNALSPRAGVTPAEYIYGLDKPTFPTSITPRTTVRASAAEARAIAKASDNPGALGTGHVLKPAKQVSGISAARAKKLVKKSRLAKRTPGLAGDFRAGNGGGGTDVDYPIVPGGSIATTYSTGTITTAAVGTVTAVCGNKVYAFGHPDDFTGASNQTFNGAQTVAIQEDGIFSPSFKLANIGKVKGVLNQDRLEGIVGTLGQKPARTITVRTTTTSPRLSKPRVSVTAVNEPNALSYTVASQLFMDTITGLNQYSSGDALMSWQIDYTRSGAKGTKTFKRTQRYSSSETLPDEVSFDVASDVEALMRNGFERVTISQVRVSSSLRPEYRKVRPTRAQHYSKGKWRNIGSNGLRVKPGTAPRIRLRVGPADFDSTAPVSYTSSARFKTSKHSRGTGRIEFTGQATRYFDEEDFGDEMLEYLLGGGDEEEVPQPTNLDEVLALLSSQQRQDNVVGVLSSKTKHRKLERERTVRGPSVVSGSFRLKFRFTK